MEGYKVFLAVFCIICAHFSSVQSLTCKFGFGISEPGSHELKTYFDNSGAVDNCGVSGASNPVSEPKGCLKTVYELSGGNLFVEYACFSGTTKATESQYGRYIYTYVCTTDNCNSSHNLKFNLVAISAFSFLSLVKFI
ncbi:hypothetical protein BpHYR1_017954 [Brachionus plicatilis]|uniref:UPAR/Ly6 domain-containing protein n=1 Tax=Brachionus plicatilis TaxID=10195 RepID=A0A3M7PPI5_BRAPC|nr:hypothetical protein BpHYR1_017954 [Brachionus plicatilis]